jgi:hypothetical protein
MLKQVRTKTTMKKLAARMAAISVAVFSPSLMAQGSAFCYTVGWPYSVEVTAASDGGVRLLLGPPISGLLLNQEVTVTGNVVRLQAATVNPCGFPPPPPRTLQPVNVGPLAPGSYLLRTELRSPPFPPDIKTLPFEVRGQPEVQSIPSLSTPAFLGLVVSVLVIGGIAAGAVNSAYRSSS